ncbi:MAG: hypothetical protein FWE40_03275 [Oscillospiraceae bacterium]|nr:hypothetical protein [Oscillospiraceae bacterium]
MDWRTFFASTGVALVIAAIPLVKSFIDNKAKANDAIKSFRYTKLHEILVDWNKNEAKLSFRETNTKDDLQIMTTCNLRNLGNLKTYSQAARGLIDKKYSGSLDEQLQTLFKLQSDLVNRMRVKGQAITLDVTNEFARELHRAEELFVKAIEEQMRALLK